MKSREIKPISSVEFVQRYRSVLEELLDLRMHMQFYYVEPVMELSLEQYRDVFVLLNEISDQVDSNFENIDHEYLNKESSASKPPYSNTVGTSTGVDKKTIPNGVIND